MKKELETLFQNYLMSLHPNNYSELTEEQKDAIRKPFYGGIAFFMQFQSHCADVFQDEIAVQIMIEVQHEVNNFLQTCK